MQNINKKKIASVLSSVFSKKYIGNRIFTYHSINYKKNNLTSNLYQLNPKLFFDQLNYLINNKSNFTEITKFDNLKPNYLVTFDDGYKNLKINNIINFLNKNKIHCLIFVCPEFVNSNNKYYLNKSDLLEISQSKYIDIGSHTYHHKKLTELDHKDLNFQLDYSKKWLEDLLSKPIKSVAYPFGAFNDVVIKSVKSVGYDYGFTTRFNFYNNINDKFKIPRIDIWNNDDLKTFIRKADGRWNWMKFFSKY